MSLQRRFEIEIREVDNFDDLVIFLIDIENIAAGYDRLNIERPKWLTEKLQQTQLEVQVRQRARKERQLTELRMQRETLRTPDEKRKALDEQIAKLQAEINPQANAGSV